MKLHLASANREVQRLCCEVINELVGRGWTLHMASGSTAECEADLYVWEFEPGFVPSVDIPRSDRWRHFFFVDRSDIDSIRDSPAFADVCLLLKPVSKATLSAFIGKACDRVRQSYQPEIDDHTVAHLRADRDEILQCLIETNLKLQEYDQDRTKFLARAIHDFRAPLTAITGYCGLLLGEDIGQLTDDQREILERMQRSARRLSRMSTAMFQLSIRPRTEQLLDLNHGDIRDCVDQALHEIMPLAAEKGITVNVDVADQPEPLFFERAKLEQVLVNLLDNAYKFTPRSGTISVRGYPYFWDRRNAGRSGAGAVADRRRDERCAPNSFRIDISDTGPGIPAMHLPKIFEEYTSYAGGVDRSGGGLGLAICRMILNQHRGFIWAESGTAGALFSFVLPFHRADQVISVAETGRKAVSVG